MADYFGITSTNTNFLNNYFGNSSSSNTSSGVNMYSGINLSDYAFIRNGTYSKMMNQYYTTFESDEDVSGDKVDESKSLSLVKGASQSLYKSATNLTSVSLYMIKKGEDGNETYDYDAIYEKVNDFVKSYNSMLDSFDNVENTSLLRKGISMVDSTAANAKMLEKVGITIKEDNTLSLDKDKLKEAKISDLTTMFTGFGSYASKVANKASQMNSLAAVNLSVMSRKNASAYTGYGTYTSPSITSFTGYM